MLNPIEEEALEIFHRVLDAWTGKTISRLAYRELLGFIRDVVKKLENKQYGCRTGQHAGYCVCNEATGQGTSDKTGCKAEGK